MSTVQDPSFRQGLGEQGCINERGPAEKVVVNNENCKCHVF
jgi:hypothetical protein